MKRTAATLALLAGLGGGCSSTNGPSTVMGPSAKQPTAPAMNGFGAVTRPQTLPGYQGPAGEPVIQVAGSTARGAMPSNSAAPNGASSAAAPSSLADMSSIQRAGTRKPPTTIRGYVPGISTVDSRVIQANDWQGFGHPQQGIIPVPGMGPPGAVAAVGAMNPMMRPAPINQRTSIRFTGLAGMKITWQLPDHSFNGEESGLTAPADYNFLQGRVYRLRLTKVLPNFPGKTFYPTLEIAPATPKTVTYLAHNSVPVTFKDEEFRQAADGNLVVKVIYLPDPAFQDFAALGGLDEIVSTPLEPGADPVAEAQKRGTILAIVRMGSIDLENKYSPTMTAPPPGAVVPARPALAPMPMAPTAPPPVARPRTPSLLPPIK